MVLHGIRIRGGNPSLSARDDNHREFICGLSLREVQRRSNLCIENRRPFDELSAAQAQDDYVFWPG